jgi:hypothetical protein
MKSISNLYADFEKAHAAYQTLPTEPEKPFERAVDKCGRIAWRIVKAPANNLDEMLIKIRIAGWAAGAPHKRLDQLDRWMPNGACTGEEFAALVSLREDLHRLKASAR